MLCAIPTDFFRFFRTPVDPVERQTRDVKYSSYTVNYCATCQTGGKVLADNTTSKFLK